jgi:hypothetical protein
MAHKAGSKASSKELVVKSACMKPSTSFDAATGDSALANAVANSCSACLVRARTESVFQPPDMDQESS